MNTERRRSFFADWITADAAMDIAVASLFLVIVSAVVGGCIELIDHVSGVLR